MKKQKPHPLTEGCLATIYKRFLAPLVRYKHPDMDLHSFWEHLFHAEERQIQRFRVDRPFKMPGLFYTAPTIKVQGIGERNVKEGDVLFVRTDSLTPNQIDVEWLKPGQDYVYELTSSEWGLIKLKCTLMERKRR